MGASIDSDSIGRFMLFDPSVCRQSTPSSDSPAPVPPQTSSLTMNRLPSARTPPKASITDSPADGAGTRSGTASENALTIAPQIRLIVAVRALTAAGAEGLTSEPSGRCSVTGLKQPPFVGMRSSVSARTA
jgi:hypothetical protein